MNRLWRLETPRCTACFSILEGIPASTPARQDAESFASRIGLLRLMTNLRE